MLTWTKSTVCYRDGLVEIKATAPRTRTIGQLDQEVEIPRGESVEPIINLGSCSILILLVSSRWGGCASQIKPSGENRETVRLTLCLRQPPRCTHSSETRITDQEETVPQLCSAQLANGQPRSSSLLLDG